uniref:Uncharacterized protein n=1 Tax=Rhizophora mucronata TaxID=61149 RepID=A0A2P2ND64_RHIMU
MLKCHLLSSPGSNTSGRLDDQRRGKT